MKTIADILGVARSNLIEQVQRPRALPTYRKADDVCLLPLLRAIVDERPTYGYRRRFDLRSVSSMPTALAG